MSLDVAKTILAQLGGNKFLAMTGVKRVVGRPDGISFRLPRAYNGINAVHIALAADLYDVEFHFISGQLARCRVVAAEKEVFAEDLQRIFTAHTGLDTHL